MKGAKRKVLKAIHAIAVTGPNWGKDYHLKEFSLIGTIEKKQKKLAVK